MFQNNGLKYGVQEEKTVTSYGKYLPSSAKKTQRATLAILHELSQYGRMLIPITPYDHQNLPGVNAEHPQVLPKYQKINT